MILFVLLSVLGTALAACPEGLTANDAGVCCNNEGKCCPDLPGSICCSTFDDGMCCPAGLTFTGGLLRPTCCDDNGNCCPAGGFNLEANGQCCDSDGICCELNAASCTCSNGENMFQGTSVDTYQPNGCGAQVWVQGSINIVDKVTQMWSDSCREHDVCYVECARSQDDCDSQFYNDMKDDCKSYYAGSVFSGFRTKMCNRVAKLVYGKLKQDNDDLGGHFYRQGRQEFCTCSNIHL